MERSIEHREARASEIPDFAAAGRLIDAILQEDDGPHDAYPNIDGYRIQKLLGRGGGGEVFLAIKDGSTSVVAIKLLHRALGNARADKRAWRELDVLSELQISGVPTVEDYGIINSRMYVVTSHVEGLTLGDFCAQHNPDRRRRVELMVRIAGVAQQLHEHSVIHRDIKPDNIIIQRDGEPVIVDFGIVSLLNDDPSSTIGEDGTPVGTVGFMAPEQARGDRSQMSVRSDVFGLGATLCHLLTGSTPHDVKTSLHEAIRRVAQDPPRNPVALDPTMPKPLATIITRATSPKPEDRYASVASFIEDLDRWLKNLPIEWQRPSWMNRQMLALRRNPRGFLARAAVAATIVLLFVTSTVALAQWRAERTNAAQSAALAAKEQHFAAEWKLQAEQQRKSNEKIDEYQRVQHDMVAEQINALEKSQAEGQLYDATLELWALGQHIQRLQPDDKELIRIFVDHFSKLIDAAGKARPSP